MSSPLRKYEPLEREQEPPRAGTELLFRPEAVAAQQTQWLGTVLLRPKVTSIMLVVGALIAGAAVLLLVVLGSFTRKAHINGWLVPEQGLARIFAPQTGVVTHLYAQEGMKVTKGTPLVAISSEVQSEAAGAVREEIVQRLARRRDSLAEARKVQDRLFQEQSADLNRRLESLNLERRSLTRQLDLERVKLDLNDSARDRSMQGRDLISIKRAMPPAETAYLDQFAKVQALERSRAAFDREILQLQGTLRELPLRRQNQLAELERGVAELEQQLAEAEARRQVVITAPQDGTVTGVQTELGGTVTASVPVMSLVPAGSLLQAQLFSPSRAIGFVRPGQRVLLRYEAFPYQKFGFYEGTIRSVSRSAVSPAEMTQQLAGLASLYGANEPIYRVTVDLAQQTATAYGEAVPLQPGMQVDADVMIESRRLIEWVLDPLYSLTGKLK